MPEGKRRRALQTNTKRVLRGASTTEDRPRRISPRLGNFISRLPAELLLSIFEIAHKVAYSWTPTHHTLLPRPEASISQVCRTWRAVAISSKKLWTNYLYVPLGRTERERLEAYLKYSKDAPVSLIFDLRYVTVIVLKKEGNIDLSLKPQVRACLELAMKHVARWKDFTVIAPNPHVLTNTVQDVVQQTKLHNKAAPFLESFAVLVSHLQSPEEEVIVSPLVSLEPRMLTGGVPNLKSLRLNDLTALAFLPPLESLTELCLESSIHDSFVSREALAAILQLPRLTRLCIRGDAVICQENDDYHWLPATINLPALKELWYDAEYGDDLGALLSRLVAPCLKTLAIGSVALGTWDENATTPGQAPLSSVRTVLLVGTENHLEFCAWLSNLTPNVTSLKIIGCDEIIANEVNPFTGWNDIQKITYYSHTSSFDAFLAFCHLQPNLKSVRVSGRVGWGLRKMNTLSDEYRVGLFMKFSAAFPEVAVFKLPCVVVNGTDHLSEDGIFDGMYA